MSTNLELTDNEKKLLEIMKRIAVDNVVPTYCDEYVDGLGFKRTTILKIIRELDEKGYVIKKHGKCILKNEKEESKVEVETVEVNEEEEVDRIIKLYRTRINNFITRDEREGLRELYFWLKNARKINDAFEYMSDAIVVFAKKAHNKRHFPYLVRIVRNWGIYGKWSMPTQEDSALYDIFKNLTGLEPTEDTKRIIQALTSKYGAIKLTYVMTDVLKANVDIDITKILINRVRKKIESEANIESVSS